MVTPDNPDAGQDSVDSPGLFLPGHTVDELRAQSRAAEARAEFERLLQEGMDSGVDARAPSAIFDSARTEIRSRAAGQAGDSKGGNG